MVSCVLYSFEKGEVSIKEISDNLNVSHSAISQLITGLQQKGLIKSVVSKKDARHKANNLYSKRAEVAGEN